MNLTNEQIARVCHEANRGYQAAVPTPGIPVAVAWDDFPAGQQVGVVSGVAGIIAGNTPEQSHESWCAFKRAQSWTYGPVKNEQALMHPCLVPYSELPPEQRVKDDLFSAIVKALTA